MENFLGLAPQYGHLTPFDALQGKTAAKFDCVLNVGLSYTILRTQSEHPWQATSNLNASRGSRRGGGSATSVEILLVFPAADHGVTLLFVANDLIYILSASCDFCTYIYNPIRLSKEH